MEKEKPGRNDHEVLEAAFAIVLGIVLVFEIPVGFFKKIPGFHRR